MGLPLPDHRFELEEFWTSGADGRLMVQRCEACTRLQHPPMPRCRRCHATTLAGWSTSGEATVFSFTINHQPWTRDLDVPYVLAIVALDDDPTIHLTTRLVDVAPDDVSIGMLVSVRFEESGDVWLPLFAPRERAA